MKYKYELVGLERLKSGKVVAVIDSPGLPNLFKAEIAQTPERIDAMWRYVENDWDCIRVAKLKFDGVDKKGYPIKPVLEYFQEI